MKLPFLVMEYLEGETLQALLRRVKVGLLRALDILSDVAAGLAHAHARQLIHLDLKPGNVFICGTGKAKLLDFGLAQLLVGPRPCASRAAPGRLLICPRSSGARRCRTRDPMSGPRACSSSRCSPASTRSRASASRRCASVSSPPSRCPRSWSAGRICPRRWRCWWPRPCPRIQRSVRPRARRCCVKSTSCGRSCPCGPSAPAPRPGGGG